MHCLVATRSQGKIREIRALLGVDPSLTIATPDQLGIDYSPDEDSIEHFDTFRENAMAKALYFARLSGLPTIADDSGIAVAALGGAPGVRSKRFALDQMHASKSDDAGTNTVPHRHELYGEALDQANNDLLLRRLQDLPAPQRGAHYACAVALALPGHPILTTIGTVSGFIATEPRGDAGFGYDPIFLVPELGRTFAEIPAAEKNRRSHRARAFNALRSQLSHALSEAYTYLPPRAHRSTHHTRPKRD